MPKLSDPDAFVARGSLPARNSTLRELAESRLRTSPYPAVRRLACDCHDGVLTLRGQVPSYYHKQMACTLLGRLAGVEKIVDDIEVVDPRAAAAAAQGLPALRAGG